MKVILLLLLVKTSCVRYILRRYKRGRSEVEFVSYLTLTCGYIFIIISHEDYYLSASLCFTKHHVWSLSTFICKTMFLPRQLWYVTSHFDYPLQIFSFISLHFISLLTLFAAAQSLSVVLEGGAPTVNSYAGKVSSDGTTLTLSGTARLYMLNANGNAYQVFNNILLFSPCSHLLTIFCSCLISSTKRSATMSIPLKLDVEVMERCISTT